MNRKTIIKCQDLTVKFAVNDIRLNTIKASLTGFREKKIEFKALDCVSIQISEGDRIGLLGRNGAGKTTFLQTLAGVYHQTDGSLSINAPTTSFFQVGVGTDPDASGFDNILLMALGYQNRFDEVLQVMILQN